MKPNIVMLIVATAFGTTAAKAQTNVGSTAVPDASAQLQATSTTKGILFPKVALTATTTFGLAGNTKTAGLTVYNTTSGITGTTAYPATGVGLYTWDGTGWVTGNGAVNPNSLGSALFLQATADNQFFSGTTVVFNFNNALYSSGDFNFNGGNVTFLKTGTYLVNMQFSVAGVSAGARITAGIALSDGSGFGYATHYAKTATTGTVGELVHLTFPVKVSTANTTGINFYMNCSSNGTLIAQETSSTGTGYVSNVLIQRIGN